MHPFRHREPEVVAPSVENTIASLKNVTKAYAGLVVVKNLSLDVNLGEFAILTGHSGSGKTTALGLLGAFTKPTEGEVVLFGQSLNQLKPKEVNRIKRGHLGICFQNALLDGSFTVADVIRQTPGANDIDVQDEQIHALAKRFGMANKVNQYCTPLSGGEKMRVAMMRAMVSKPDLILLDEPIGSIDDKGKHSVLELIREVVDQDQTTVLMVSHDPDITRRYVDRELMMADGQLVGVNDYTGIGNHAA
jgi:ABC-type lipoprotein export system ATPase subunit